MTRTGTEADELFLKAAGKYDAAVEINADMHQALFNLACLRGIRGDAAGTVEHLLRCAGVNPDASRSQLDRDSGFDAIRDHPEFRAFRKTLPQ